MEGTRPSPDGRAPRVVGVLVGDIARHPGARVKYGFLCEAVGRRLPLVEVHDASLQGVARLINALRVAHPNRRRWRERFHMNVPAFCARSRRAASHLRSLLGRANVVLQIGVLFDARWNDLALPSVIYTDYTAHLSAQNPEAGRSPFTPRQQQQWIALERRALQRAAHVCTRSQLVRRSVLADYGLAPDKVTVVGGGVNLDRLPDLVTDTDYDIPTALFIGKELHRKGGDLLLKAFALARASVPSARLLLVTADRVPSDLPLDGVQVIAPTWNRQMIMDLFRRSDVFALPSRLETWGDVLLEAMAFALPCIGVSGQAMEDIIVDDETGLIAPSQDTHALGSLLARLLADAPLRRRMGHAARARVEAEFTWDRVAERLAGPLEAAARSAPILAGPKVAPSAARTRLAPSLPDAPAGRRHPDAGK